MPRGVHISALEELRRESLGITPTIVYRFAIQRTVRPIRRIRAEPPLPRAVAQDDQRLLPSLFVIGEDPAEGRTSIESRSSAALTGDVLTTAGSGAGTEHTIGGRECGDMRQGAAASRNRTRSIACSGFRYAASDMPGGIRYRLTVRSPLSAEWAGKASR